MAFGARAPAEPLRPCRERQSPVCPEVFQMSICTADQDSQGRKARERTWGLSYIYASSASNVKIDGLEEKLACCRQSIEEVDLKLRREKLSPEGRKSLERERNLLMTKADNYEKELSALRKENRKNAALAVAMGLLIALIYICWTM
ncbi:PREDICTED: coiled-coil domain-containing protein 167 [Charadrius vociferus]|uniref:coiled-coil domain-containing protein 167 n=1 Tax=Charadrius vociferus TaxID=50402 RepID=UPI0005217229|nr:PREDICTED: coiled-coil domain-containing protein 167 [Charadrius vociferus]